MRVKSLKGKNVRQVGGGRENVAQNKGHLGGFIG